MDSSAGQNLARVLFSEGPGGVVAGEVMVELLMGGHKAALEMRVGAEGDDIGL